MKKLAAMLLLLLAACAQERDAEPDGNGTDASANGGNVNPPAQADAEVPPTTPGEARSPEAARAVLIRYFELVDAGRHDQAANHWWDEGRAAAFAAQLHGFGDYQPSIAAPGRIEGAAGSAYVSISLQLLRGSRTLTDGTAVLRRVNDVPGSTAEQRRWRIDRISLQPPPRTIAYRFVGRWATEESGCAERAWRFTADSLRTPAGSVCNFRAVREVPGGYDIAARCTAEGPPVNDTLELRFAESARALLFESDVIADAGLVRCG